MKRFTLLFVLLVFTLSLSFASAQFTFGGGCNIYGAVLTDGTVNVGSNSIVIKTTKNKARAESDLVSFTMERNTLLELKVEEERVTLYLVDGKISVKTEDGVTVDICTPVTKTEVTGKMEITVISTETEEKIYNASSSPLTGYDAIRGEYVMVEAKSTHDYFKGYVPPKKETKVEVETPVVEEVVTEEEIVPVIVPQPPVFLSPNIKLKEVND